MFSKIKQFIFSFKNYNTGALPDIRTQEEKKKDYSIHETVGVVSSEAVNWVEKPEISWRKYPVQNQYSSYACVAETARKMLRVAYKNKYKRDLDFSSTYIYQQRINKPTGGMGGIDVFKIMQKGTALNSMVTSDLKSDSLIDYYKVNDIDRKVASIFKTGNYVQFPTKDIDIIASTIQKTKKAVMVWFYFTSPEWSPFVPVVKDVFLNRSTNKALKHSVAVVDYTLYKGKKALIIEDSAHFGGLTRRVITEDFFKARCFFSAYVIDFYFTDLTNKVLTTEVNPILVEKVKPKYTFSKELKFVPLDSSGNISNILDNNIQLADVAALQNILKYEGLFPTNIVSTGYYGAVTARAVDSFQRKYKVAPVSELDSLKGRNVGPKTIAKLNELYS